VSGRVVERSTEIVIETPTRWDALDLARRLPTCRWFLVERDPERWDVHVSLEEVPRRLAEDVAGVAEEWAASRLDVHRLGVR
jgi:hypothetical protein